MRLISLAYGLPAICHKGAVQSAKLEREIEGPGRANADASTVAGFGDEWSRFDQSALSAEEHAELFDKYFHLVQWDALPPGAQGFDLGCGSGRWARGVAPRIGTLHLIDASADALAVARRNLSAQGNCEFHHASVDAMPIPEGSMDFGYSLGVLHHVPDTAAGLRACVSRLKIGAPFVLYLYYAFDNRPAWFRAVWRVSDAMRQGISRMPMPVRYAMSQAIAAAVYWPLARTAAVLERTGADVAAFPLSFYRDRSFYTMRTDALDRFGTRLEQRFTRAGMQTMMERAGLDRIRFSDRAPFWVAIGHRRA
jgi:SAM-dependent methyltransferase